MLAPASSPTTVRPRHSSCRLAFGLRTSDSYIFLLSPNGCGTVTTHYAAESAKKGAFSATSRQRLAGRAAADEGFRLVESRRRLRGHQSRSKSTKGQVTSIGLLIRPRAKRKRGRGEELDGK